MKKQLICLGLTLALFMAPAIARAEGGAGFSATGSIVGAHEVAIPAPISGALAPFTLRAGDRVAAGDPLFRVEPERLYAEYDGVVRGVLVAPGDSASAATALMGAALYIEPDPAFIIRASTSGGYDSRDNRIIHPGEAVYLKSRASRDYTGEGRIISVSGNSYTVEVTGGNLRFEEAVNIFRKADHSDASRIGRGDVSRRDPIAITLSGTVLAVHISDGQSVKKGDLLLEYAPDALPAPDAAREDMAIARAPSDMILSSVLATPGARVSKDQTLALAYPANRLQAAAEVDARDIGRIHAGDAVTVDCEDAGALGAKGRVASVAFMPIEGLDEYRYAVYVDFELDEHASVRPGMRATVHFEP